MQIKFDGLCRGSGKIFIKIDANLSSPNNTISVQNRNESGSKMPVRMYRMQDSNTTDKSYVAILPNMPITQTLVFTEIDAEGKPTGKPIEKSVNNHAAKWESRLNYKVNKALTKQIRDFDERAEYDHIRIKFWEIIPLEGENFRVRIQLEVPYSNPTDMKIRCLTTELEPVDSSFTFLGEERTSPYWTKDLGFRILNYSIVLKKRMAHYLFIAEDANNPGFNGFAVLKPSNCKRLISDWIYDHHSANTDELYPEWFDLHRARAADITMQAKTHLDIEPMFSIIVPIFKTPLNLFDEMVCSVVGQSYANWELLLVNASPGDQTLTSRIETAAKSESRIREVRLEENLGISLNTRAGIDAACGDYVCFLDHDDIIEPDALFAYAQAINNDPQIDLIYCDEDKLGPDGELSEPYLKPDFSIDLLRNNNYICHMLCVRKAMIDSLDLYTQEVDGAQDHDLTLKVAEKSSHIHHVRHVLYHWRICEGSTTSGAGAKPYAEAAGIRAVQSHLDRLGIRAKVTPGDVPFSYDVEYLVDDINPLISIIIPTKDESKVLANCIDSILEKTTYSNYEIVVIENNSTEPETFAYYKQLERHPKIRVERWGAEFNFSKLMNFGAGKSSGEYMVLLNNDTEVITENWLERMLGVCRRDEVGIVGVRLWYPDDTIQHAGVIFNHTGPGHINQGLPRGNAGYFGLSDKPQDLSAVTAACMMVKRSVFDAVNGFDESFAVAFNDVDFCLKVRELGKLVVYLPSVELYHYESLSRGYEDTPEKRIRFCQEDAQLRLKWPKYFILGDPYYNPAFSKESWRYQLAW